jgi:hypothetical protein
MGDSMSTIINATTTNGVVIQPDNSGSLVLQTNSGTTALTIDTSQNVGIGTSSPANKLHISATGGATFLAATDTTNSITSYFGSYNSVNWIGTTTAFPITFNTNASERMRIDSSGNVLIGLISTTTTSGIALIPNEGGQVGYAKFGHVTGTATGNQYIYFQYGGTTIGSITQNGTTATAYNTSSDYRLKENIAPMIRALDTIAQLKPVTYNWKADGSVGQGFIAHELQEIVPDCVTGKKDAVETYTDEDGVEQTRPKYQGVDTSFLVATLTAAIQEQQTIINDLKARITALEGAA